MAVFRMPAPAIRLQPKPATIDFSSGGIGADVSIQARGFRSLSEMLLEMPKVAVDAAGYEMADIAAEIIADSKENWVPYEFGDLRESAGHDEYSPSYNYGRGSFTEIRMWYGAPMSAIQAGKAARIFQTEGLKVADPSTYALDQHENLSYTHPNVGPVTMPRPKFLEGPFLEKEPTILRRIAAKISDSWGGTVEGLSFEAREESAIGSEQHLLFTNSPERDTVVNVFYPS